MGNCCECFTHWWFQSCRWFELNWTCLLVGAPFYMDRIRYGTPGRGLNPRVLVAGNLVLNLPLLVYNELWRMRGCNKEFSLCLSQNAACLPWQVSRSCPELLNLESQSTWRCQWSTLNVQWLCMIIWTWVLSSWRFSAVNEIWTRDRSSKEKRVDHYR